MKGRSGNRVSNTTVSMRTGKGEGKSAAQNTAVGSGSRPTPSRHKIASSNPISSQKIRPSNPSEGTNFKG